MSSFANAPVKTGEGRQLRTRALAMAKRFLRKRDGVTAIEFAYTLPLLLLIVFGTLEFGRALKVRNEMSHALSKAVRVVNLDSQQTTAEIQEKIGEYLSKYTAQELSVNVTSTTLSGTDYMNISVSFPFHATIPLSNASLLNLKVVTLAPVVSATK